MSTCSPTWLTTPLHRALVAALPAFVIDPFSDTPQLNVPRLRAELEFSHETVYRWLRTGRISAGAAKKVVILAGEPTNAAALERLGLPAPDVKDFAHFHTA